MRKRRQCSIVFLAFLGVMGLGGLLSPAARADHILYSIDVDDSLLHTVDPLTAATLTTTTITLAGFTVFGGNGLAADPITGTLYAVLRTNSGRRLATVDPATGVATDIGNLGDSYAGLAFDVAGQLYGVTGDGATTPETLFTINKTNASTTLFLALGNGTDGEAIAFNPVDGMMYHASGHVGDFDVIFEKINLTTLAITDIPINGTALTDEEAQALAYRPSEGVFYWKQDHGLGPLFRVTPGGVPTLIGDLDHQSKGLAFNVHPQVIPEPTTIMLVGVGFAALVVACRRRKK